MAGIHHRMPVILAPETHDRWLSTETPARELQSLLVPYPAGQMRTYPVTTRVNSPRFDDQLCLEPVPSGYTVTP